MTDGTNVFSTKAANYARYRWDYAPQAIQAIVDAVHLSAESVVADVGAGTGILTRHFLERVHRVFAVEPNREMRAWAATSLARYPSFHSVDGRAEATTLANESVDLIVVGTAIHWFEPEATKREFTRILRPAGWLAIVGGRSTDLEMNAALEAVCIPENGWDTSDTMPWPKRPVDYYYGSDAYVRASFPGTWVEPWEAFLGAIISNSCAPDEDHPLYGNLERALKGVFDRFSTDGQLTVPYSTEVCLGQMKG
jgi:ubiquinone/menaquinone biosynthesis C-methylase UbiE